MEHHHLMEPTRRFFSWDAAVGYVLASITLWALHAVVDSYLTIHDLQRDANCAKTAKP
jgi:hypothetical protein